MRRGKDRTADSSGTVDDPGDGCGPFLPEDGRNRAHHKAERHRTGAASDQQPVNQNQHPDMSTKRRQKESPAEHQRTDRQNAGICPFQCQRSEYRLGHAVKKLRQRNGKAYRCRIKACCVLNCRRDQPEIDPDTTVLCTDQAANKCNEYDTSYIVLLFLFFFRLALCFLLIPATAFVRSAAALPRLLLPIQLLRAPEQTSREGLLDSRLSCPYPRA